MEVFSTNEFDKDFKKADKEATERIKKILDELKSSNFIGKPLRHLKNTYTVRINNKRFVYKVEEDKVTLLFFKSREDIYDYLR